MKPEYLRELADLADPDKLWKLPLLDQLDLPDEKRKRLDTGIALRRYARHVETLQLLIGTRRSLLISPLSENSSAEKTIKMPGDHVRLLLFKEREPDAVFGQGSTES